MSDKVALITAAGSGMGAAVARKLAEQDYKIAILSSSGRGEDLAQELGGIGITGSNRNVADLEPFVQAAVDAYGKIDVVCCNAGIPHRGNYMVKMEVDEFDRMFIRSRSIVSGITPNDINILVETVEGTQ